MSRILRHDSRVHLIAFLLAQSERIILFPGGQQRSVGSDLGTMELKLEPTVKIQPQNPRFPLPHRVSHINTKILL